MIFLKGPKATALRVEMESASYWLLTPDLGPQEEVPFSTRLRIELGLRHGDPGVWACMRGRKWILPGVSSKFGFLLELLTLLFWLLILPQYQPEPSAAVVFPELRYWLGVILLVHLYCTFMDAIWVSNHMKGNGRIVGLGPLGLRIEPVIASLVNGERVLAMSLVRNVGLGAWAFLGIANPIVSQGLLIAAMLGIAGRLLWYGQGRWNLRCRAEYMEPSSKAISLWKQQCAVLAHVPELRNYQWQWVLVSSEEAQIGLKDAMAYAWCAQTGVLDRPARMNEIALQCPGLRLFLAEAFTECLDHEARRRLALFAQLSQVLANHKILAQLAGVQREHWLAHARMQTVPGGMEILARQEEVTWLGLLLQGVLEGSEQGAYIPGTLLGESSLTGGGKSKESIMGRSACLIAKWELGWLQANYTDKTQPH